MLALILYGALEPFLDDAADKLATFAQLMTFLTLFTAILLTTDALQGAVPSGLLAGVMIVLNVDVVAYDRLSVALTGGGMATNYGTACGCSSRDMSAMAHEIQEEANAVGSRVDHALVSGLGGAAAGGGAAETLDAIDGSFVVPEALREGLFATLCNLHDEAESASLVAADPSLTAEA